MAINEDVDKKTHRGWLVAAGAEEGNFVTHACAAQMCHAQAGLDRFWKSDFAKKPTLAFGADADCLTPRDI